MNTTFNNNLPALSNEGGLSAYLEQIKKFPMLAAEEEYMLAKNWKSTGNQFDDQWLIGDPTAPVQAGAWPARAGAYRRITSASWRRKAASLEAPLPLSASEPDSTKAMRLCTFSEKLGLYASSSTIRLRGLKRPLKKKR